MAAEFLRHAEIQADRFGVADMQIAVRLRRKTGNDRLMPADDQIGADDVADEILTGFPYCRFRRGHERVASVMPRRRLRRAPGVDKLAGAVKSASKIANSLTSFHF